MARNRLPVGWRRGQPCGGQREATSAGGRWFVYLLRCAGVAKDPSRLEGSAAAKARRTLTSLLAEGKGAGSLHLCLGIDAWNRGQKEQALVHLGRAHALAPELGPAANNLAWVLAHGPSPDLPRALEIINALLARWPKEAVYRDTRGHILLRSGKFEEAVADLEFALPQLPPNAETHRALATAYERIGLTEVAAAHRRKSETLDAR